MKRFVAVILILLFAANVSGATISYHFCGKMLQYFAFNGQKKKSKCCCKGTQKKKGCCKTEHHKVQVDDGKSFAKQLVFQKYFELDAIITLTFFDLQPGGKLTDFHYVVPLGHSPPFVRTVSVHILYQQFLI